MNRNLIRITSAIIGLILLTVIVLGLSGERGIASQPNQSFAGVEELGRENISHRIPVPLSAGASSTSWTIEEMQAAKPYPLEIIADEPAVSLELSMPDGLPGVVASSPPGLKFSTASNSVETLAPSEVTIVGYEYPPPYARYQNFDSYLSYPYSTVGVMFFKQGGIPFRCSAASIGNYAIWTAGHCVHAGDGKLDKQGNVIDDGTWSTEIIFAPAYPNGDIQFGVWTGFELWITPEWFGSKDLRYDMGGVVLNINGGQKISQVVGNLGLAFNQANKLHWMNIAYPSEAPFNGSSQQICAASFAYADTSMPAPSPIAMGCDMTRGSSGGPWVLDFSGSAGGSNLLNGNNSYRYGSHPKELYSPYFGSGAKSLWDDLTGSVPPPP